MRISDWSSDVCSSDLYFTALEGDRDGQIKDFSQTLAFAQLLHNQTQTDQRLVAFCEVLREKDLARCVDLVRVDGVVRERIDRLLLPLFEHQLHHPGHVHTMLSAPPFNPPPPHHIS